MTPIDWFYAKGEKQSGPVNSVELKRLATTGELRPDDLVWREGMAEWTVARNVRGLFDEANKTPAASNATAAPGSTAPPKVIDPVPVSPSANSPTAFAPVAPQVRAVSAPAGHFFDGFLNFIKSQFSAAFVETTTKTFVTLGKYGLLAALGLILLVSILTMIKVKPFPTDFIALETGWLISLIALQYIAVRLCGTLERLYRANNAGLSSGVLLNCIALFSMAAGVGALIEYLFLARDGNYIVVLHGLTIFTACQYLAFIALNPGSINIQVVAENRPSEEALALLWFFLKASMRLVPVVFGTVAILGSLQLIYAVALIFTGSGPDAAMPIAKDASSWLVGDSTLPLVAVVAFYVATLGIEICRSILAIPTLANNSPHPELKSADESQ